MNNYLPLLIDSPTIGRTLKQVFGSPRTPAEDPYGQMQARGFADPIHPGRTRLRVARIRRETESTSTFVLEPAAGPLPAWSAGQYVNIFVEVNGVRTSRPMSISTRSGRSMELS